MVNKIGGKTMKTNNTNTELAKVFVKSFINSFCQSYVIGCATIAIAKNMKAKRLLKERAAIGKK